MNNMNYKRAFTLIELLVVIAVIAILAAILFPVFIRVQKLSQETVCKTHLKQIGTAMMMYADDNCGQWIGDYRKIFFRFGNNNMYAIDAHDYGKWYWMFVIKGYLSKQAPADYHTDSSSRNIFVCPSKPVYKDLNTKNQILSLRTGGLDKQFGLTYKTGVGYRIFCSYAINEHIPYKYNNLTVWRKPSRSFMLLEANDTEITGNQLYTKLRYIHNGGLNIVYLDGHVSWHKAEYKGDPKMATTQWTFPPGGPNGGLGPPDTAPDKKDVGPWVP